MCVGGRTSEPPHTSCVGAQDESGRCFPGRPQEEQTFAYLVIDPHKRHVTLFSHVYGVGDLEL